MNKINHYIYVFYLCFFISCTNAQPPLTTASTNVDYLSSINNFQEFESLQANPLSEKYSNVKSVKIIYEIETDHIYFIQSAKYKYHFSFANNYLASYDDLAEFNNTEYSVNKKRKYLLPSLNYFQSSGLFVIDFFADDVFEEKHYNSFIKKIKANVYFKNALRVLPNQWMKAWTDKNMYIKEEDIFGKQNYQVLVAGTTFGYLRLFKGKDISKEVNTEHDIIITDRIPLNLPPVMGIVTANFQTPLSHINILAHARGTPNCALKNIFSISTLQKLDGKLVKLIVSQDTISITEPEAGFDFNKYLATKESKLKPTILSIDTSLHMLTDVNLLSKKNIAAVGGKAAHFGELTKIISKGKKIPLPENGFAIPVYYYLQHLKNNNINSLIAEFLQITSIRNDEIQTKTYLKKIRKAIADAPIDNNLLTAVISKMKRNKLFTDYRFRSSTNAEDIQGFSGAGLYESKTGSLTDTTKPIDKAIKKVWASLWNEQAFYEREKALINQQSVAMAILVHRSFGTEEVNGVAITADMYRKGYPSFTINAQQGEVSVANADDSVPVEQLLIKFSDKLKTNGGIAMEYITYSPLNNYSALMIDKEIKELINYLAAIKKHFYQLYKKTAPYDYDEFAVDVEFKLNKGDRKIYIKQARLY